MKKLKIGILALIVPLFIAGCVGSGTLIIVFELAEFVSSSSGIEVMEIDLTSNDDYNDNKDKIKSIEQVTVVGWLSNELQTENQAQIYIADVGTYSTPAEVEANATRVFTSPVIPGGDTVFIDWTNGLSHIENLPALKDAADAGHFWLYGVAADNPFMVRFRITLVITLTAGL